MSKNIFKVVAFSIICALTVSGCATARAKKPPVQDAQSQITAMQSELQAKDQQIQDLQNQLDSYQRSIGSSSNYSSYSSSSGGSSSVIKARGVSVSDLQSALLRAGFDPGPVDGKLGKKTKAAIKAFQRRNNLRADGVVGEKTWSLLK